MRKGYDKEQIIEIMDDFMECDGKLPPLKEMPIHHTVISRIFGSWNDAKLYYEKWKRGMDLPNQPKDMKIKDGLIEKLRDNLTTDELKTLVQSSCSNKSRGVVNPPAETKEIGYAKFIATGDSHIGHGKFREDWWNAMIARGIEEEVDFMYHTGDLLEGMSGRPGHIYELSEIGFEAQFGRAKELIKNIPFEIRMINGNHDNWYTGKADQGISVGMRLEESLENVVFLGNDEADDMVAGIKVKLWHGNDGSSYALSYRTQKFVEQLYGGEKPNILLAGHAHKSVFYQTRNVNIFETGTTCMQTGFMRGKKLAAHTGYWIIEIWTDEFGIKRIRPEWNAFYC